MSVEGGQVGRFWVGGGEHRGGWSRSGVEGQWVGRTKSLSTRLVRPIGGFKN
jgi:hypothetical protein